MHSLPLQLKKGRFVLRKPPFGTCDEEGCLRSELAQLLTTELYVAKEAGEGSFLEEFFESGQEADGGEVGPAALFHGGNRDVAESFELVFGKGLFFRVVCGVEPKGVGSNFSPLFDDPLEFGGAHEGKGQNKAGRGERFLLHSLNF